MAFDSDFTVGGNTREQRVLALQALEQRRSAAVDEALGQRFVQRVGEFVLDRAGAFAPTFRVFEPIGAAGGVSPGAHVREASLQRVEIALAGVELVEFGVHPFGRRAPLGPQDIAGDAGDEARVLVLGGFAEVGQLAGLPQALDVLWTAHQRLGKPTLALVPSGARDIRRRDERLRDVAQGGDGRIALWTDSQDVIFLEPADQNSPEALKAQCAGCHTFNRRETASIGPNLWEIVDRRVGADRKFRYSEAMKDFGGRWTRERLDKFLADPMGTVPGTTMQFDGIEDAEQRKRLIDFLEELR